MHSTEAPREQKPCLSGGDTWTYTEKEEDRDEGEVDRQSSGGEETASFGEEQRGGIASTWAISKKKDAPSAQASRLPFHRKSGLERIFPAT